MPYKLTEDTWLTREVTRARGVLSHVLVRGREYTQEELLTLLEDYGLTYSNPEYIPIGLALIAEGTIEAA